jgi:hypothetical protein
LSGSDRRFSRLGTFTFAALGAAAFLLSQAPAPAAGAEPIPSAAGTAVVRAAMSHLGARYVFGATGPSAFDCSGLVYRSFMQVGLGAKIGYLRSATALYHYFAVRHLASRTSPEVGDLVIWGGGAHVGIYIGHGKAISALTNGVQVHLVSAVLSGFTTYLHTHLATVHLPTANVVSHPSPTASVRVRHVTSVAFMRLAAGTTHRRVAILHRGARLTVIGSHRTSNHQLWLHVRTASGRTGWVASWLSH